ncbi:peroxisomal membrane anchor protein conserved region-domain-containing protein [Umbelopsis sp. AD052]|nr:peroxisomal membrane anchor protein conserved region-domain-containing protein [Umbelopsis sp. AD052]
MAAPREVMLKSAVSFLSDPKVQSAPLAKKVAFLESKGLTAEEIEEAMSRANGKSTEPTTAAAPGAVAYPGGGVVMQAAPPVPARASYDWRDVFIAAVMAGGVGYGVWHLAKRLFGPLFKVPSSEDLEVEQKRLDEQFQAVEDSLKEIQEQTSTALTNVSAQSEKVNDTLSTLQETLKKLEESDNNKDEEFKSIKEDVEVIKGLIPKMLDRNKDAQATILNDLQTEVKSLKSLLLSRRPATALLDGAASSSPAVTSPPAAETNGISPRLSATFNASARPGIPSWQIAAKTAPAATETKPAGSSEKQPAADEVTEIATDSKPEVKEQ